MPNPVLAVDSTLPRTGGQNTTSNLSTSSEAAQQSCPDTGQGRFRFVVSDSVAIYYLERDPCVNLVERRHHLEGYEIYLVEQWACSRSHPSFTIATFTGHPAHKIYVGVISILRDETQWGKELTEYFRFVRFYGREKQTPLGTLMVTNLSNLPSDLTVIAVPDGDVSKHKVDFIVNEDLKRMGCSGRAALSLAAPTDATQGKFHQLFRTCERVNFYDSVLELVRLSQLALVMFQKLDKHFADGLLCDETERAIKKWWAEFGTDFYNAEPLDGILGPTTVAALLGMMIGARNRLSLCGISVPKDAFDLPAFKAAIGQFQKQHKLPRTRRLDRDTVDKIHRMTVKAPSGDKYGMVPKAIKSTVAEMSGKTYKVEMETCDIEKFIIHLSGERAKYLWHGKPMKSGVVTATIEDGGPRRNSAPATTILPTPGRPRTHAHVKGLSLITNLYDLKDENSTTANMEVAGSTAAYPLSAPAYPSGQHGFPSDSRDPLRKTMFKSMNNRMNDAKSGLGKIKDVATGVASGISGQVTRRHQRKQTQDSIACRDPSKPITEGIGLKQPEATSSAPALDVAKLAPRLSIIVDDASRSDPANIHRSNTVPTYDSSITESPVTFVMKAPFQSNSSTALRSDSKDAISPLTQVHDFEGLPGGTTGKKRDDGVLVAEGIIGSAVHSAAGSLRNHEDMIEKSTNPSDYTTVVPNHETTMILNRSQSFCGIVGYSFQRHEEYYPRRLSFSAAEEAVLDWTLLGDDADEGDSFIGPSAKSMKCTVLRVDENGKWASAKIKDVQALYPSLDRRLHLLSAMYNADMDLYHKLEEMSIEMLPREFSSLADEIGKVEVLRPKLQYEINALQAKVDEVEEYVDGFGRQVEELEKKIAELEPSTSRSGWLQLTRKWISWNKSLETDDQAS